jgi:hypothetical protein
MAWKCPSGSLALGHGIDGWRSAMQEQSMDLDAVAARLRDTRDLGEKRDYERGHALGRAWAQKHAKLHELQEFDRLDDRTYMPVGVGHSLLDFLDAEDDDEDLLANIDIWNGILDGALEVYTAVHDRI